MSQELLKNIYLFKDLSNEQLRQVSAIAEVSSFAPGDEVFSQGDPAKALYIIKYGSVRIFQKGSSGDKIEVAVLGTGSHFGEMAFIDGEKRSATAEVIERSEVYRIEYETLRKLLVENPAIAVHFFRALSHFLCGRLRITTTDLSFSREMNLRHF